MKEVAILKNIFVNATNSLYFRQFGIVRSEVCCDYFQTQRSAGAIRRFIAGQLVTLRSEQDKTYKITILHTNDHHGHFWRNDYGEYGLAAQKTLVDGIRKEVAAEGGSVLLLSGGDINTGVPESDLQDAEPDFRGMNLIGYDAMAVGNHEFDNPLSVLRQQEKWAKFPFLSANIYQKSTGERLFKPWALFKRGG